MINIRFSGVREEQVQKAATQVAAFIRRHKWAGNIELLGPTPAPLKYFQLKMPILLFRRRKVM